MTSVIDVGINIIGLLEWLFGGEDKVERDFSGTPSVPDPVEPTPTPEETSDTTGTDVGAGLTPCEAGTKDPNRCPGGFRGGGGQTIPSSTVHLSHGETTKLLGIAIRITYDQSLSQYQLLAIKIRLHQSLSLINSRSDVLGEFDSRVLGSLRLISVIPATAGGHGAGSKGTFRMWPEDILPYPTAVVASSIAHDSYHLWLKKEGKPYAYFPPELVALGYQINFGRKVGMNEAWLRSYNKLFYNLATDPEKHKWWGDPTYWHER
jgi:hypothetical protein